ncbi:MAG TPA: hypothetical protein DCY24_04350, partial [Rikenellaceae bacterium]|nr:hypothetical protein [Rikenellaceae bacterium]
KAYNVTLDSNLELYGGYAYTMNVKVGKDRMLAGNVNVIEWTEKELGEKDSYIEEYSVWDGESTESITKGSGSESDPHLIESAAQLAGLAYNINNNDNYVYKGKYFKLMKDIDLASKPWTPIGNKTHFPHLRLDGNGKSIINLKVDVGDGCAGLFYWLSGTSSTEKSVVRNL